MDERATTDKKQKNKKQPVIWIDINSIVVLREIPEKNRRTVASVFNPSIAKVVKYVLTGLNGSESKITIRPFIRNSPGGMDAWHNDEMEDILVKNLPDLDKIGIEMSTEPFSEDTDVTGAMLISSDPSIIKRATRSGAYCVEVHEAGDIDNEQLELATSFAVDKYHIHPVHVEVLGDVDDTLLIRPVARVTELSGEPQPAPNLSMVAWIQTASKFFQSYHFQIITARTKPFHMENDPGSRANRFLSRVEEQICSELNSKVETVLNIVRQTVATVTPADPGEENTIMPWTSFLEHLDEVERLCSADQLQSCLEECNLTASSNGYLIRLLLLCGECRASIGRITAEEALKNLNIVSYSDELSEAIKSIIHILNDLLICIARLSPSNFSVSRVAEKINTLITHVEGKLHDEETIYVGTRKTHQTKAEHYLKKMQDEAIQLPPHTVIIAFDDSELELNSYKAHADEFKTQLGETGAFFCVRVYHGGMLKADWQETCNQFMSALTGADHRNTAHTDTTGFANSTYSPGFYQRRRRHRSPSCSDLPVTFHQTPEASQQNTSPPR